MQTTGESEKQKFFEDVDFGNIFYSQRQQVLRRSVDMRIRSVGWWASE